MQIARLVVEHVARVHAVEGNLVACDAECDKLGVVASLHLHRDLSALLAAQALLDVAVFHLHAGNAGVVDGNDAVAGNDAHLLRRSAHDGLDDVERVLFHVELDADATELALQGFF